MKLKKFMTALVAVASLCMVSCSSDDSEPVSGKVVCPATYGVTSASARYFSDMTSFRGTDDVSSLQITAVNDNTVRVAYVSNLWGPANFESVSVVESNGVYLMEGKGSITTPDLFGGGSVEDAKTYPDFTFKGYVATDSTSYVITGVMGGMGEIKLVFTPNDK